MPIAAIVVIALGAGAFVLLGGSDEAGAEVILEPVTSTGEDPFTESVASEEVADLSSAELVGDPLAEVSGGGPSIEEVAGSVPGLYGGTGEEATCDAQALVEFLEGNPDKAAAFAGVLGIDPDEVGDYVSGLTPVVLREDTRVTNHGFENGEATGFQAVMEAGTAVMVDERGVPRVRCACGNPLAEPAAVSGSPEFSGDRWEGFEQDRLLTVAPSQEPVETFELVDIRTGETYEQVAGDCTVVDPLAPESGELPVVAGHSDLKCTEATEIFEDFFRQDDAFADIGDWRCARVANPLGGALVSCGRGVDPENAEGIAVCLFGVRQVDGVRECVPQPPG